MTNMLSHSSFLDKLSVYLEARCPIIYLESFDTQKVRQSILNEYSDTYEIIRYRNGRWLSNLKDGKPLTDSTPRSKLELVLQDYENARKQSDHPGILLLEEIHPKLSENENWLTLQELAQKILSAERNSQYNIRIVIVSSFLVLPPELAKYVSVLKMPQPRREEIEAILLQFYEREKLNPNRTALWETVKALQGLDDFEIRTIIEKIFCSLGYLIGEKAVRSINEEKQQIIQKSGLLEMVQIRNDETLKGLDVLRGYVDGFKEIFAHIDLAERNHVVTPNGILIFGMPGCGKSLSAKYAAQTYKMPLLRLDVGKMLGKYIGESENNLRMAIHSAEAAAPCVLWIDEIEKAFAGIGESSGAGDVTTRMFGHFLTWMQEKKSAIFIVATANKIEKLPPEFLRKGRFDEIFKVNFPSGREQYEILKSHVESRDRAVNIDFSSVLKAFPADLRNKYSGADIEAIVKEAFKSLFIENIRKHKDEEKLYRSLQTQDLVAAVSRVSISYDKDRYAALLKSFNQLEAKDASNKEQ